MAEGKTSILNRFREKLSRGEPLIGGGASSGRAAQIEEAGGIDLITVDNSGVYRLAGRGTLAGLMPYGNANQTVKNRAPEVITMVEHTPVLAGICGTDPLLIRDLFLNELKQLGFAGIQNFPTVALIDGAFRTNLENTGMSYRLEVDCIAAAHAQDMLTAPYACNAEEAKLMTEVGADIVVAHMGLTNGGIPGSKSRKTLADCVKLLQAIVDTCKSIRRQVMVLCHGGPITMPDDVQYILDRTDGIDGFWGASSLECLPTEGAIINPVKSFKKIRLPAVSARTISRKTS